MKEQFASLDPRQPLRTMVPTLSAALLLGMAGMGLGSVMPGGSSKRGSHGHGGDHEKRKRNKARRQAIKKARRGGS